MDSLRVEKSYRMIGTELSIEYAALESGLDRFVNLDKGDFTGRTGLLEWHQRGFANRFVTLAVDGLEDADAIGNNPLYVHGRMVGRATSGNYGFRLEQAPQSTSIFLARDTPHASCRKVRGIPTTHGCAHEGASFKGSRTLPGVNRNPPADRRWNAEGDTMR